MVVVVIVIIIVVIIIVIVVIIVVVGIIIIGGVGPFCWSLLCAAISSCISKNCTWGSRDSNVEERNSNHGIAGQWRFSQSTDCAVKPIGMGDLDVRRSLLMGLVE
jgi:hypothetical protein